MDSPISGGRKGGSWEEGCLKEEEEDRRRGEGGWRGRMLKGRGEGREWRKRGGRLRRGMLEGREGRDKREERGWTLQGKGRSE